MDVYLKLDDDAEGAGRLAGKVVYLLIRCFLPHKSACKSFHATFLCPVPCVGG